VFSTRLIDFDPHEYPWEQIATAFKPEDQFSRALLNPWTVSGSPQALFPV
jgi:hypothetical protein